MISEAVEHYRTLSIKELRRYQEIIQAQIPEAYRQRNSQALADLQLVDELVATEIHRKAFQ